VENNVLQMTVPMGGKFNWHQKKCFKTT